MDDQQQDKLFRKQFMRVLAGQTDLFLKDDIIFPAIEQYVSDLEQWVQADNLERKYLHPEEIEERHLTLGYWKAILEAVRKAPE
jgi:hypothetical protein